MGTAIECIGKTFCLIDPTISLSNLLYVATAIGLYFSPFPFPFPFPFPSFSQGFPCPYCGKHYKESSTGSKHIRKCGVALPNQEVTLNEREDQESTQVDEMGHLHPDELELVRK